jgi:hypothetical protein
MRQALRNVQALPLGQGLHGGGSCGWLKTFFAVRLDTARKQEESFAQKERSRTKFLTSKASKSPAGAPSLLVLTSQIYGKADHLVTIETDHHVPQKNW